MRWVEWRVWSAAAAALVLCAAPAGATEPSAADKARAATLVRTGAQAAKAGQWQACIEALSAALALEVAPRTAGDLGLCEEQAGQLGSAHRHLLQARQAAPAADKGKDPFTRYQEALARVTARVAIVFISTHPTDARVVLDGRPLGVADGTHVALEPGKHTFIARRDGYEDARKEQVFTAPSIPHVHLGLTAKPKAPEPQPSAPQGPAKAPGLALAPLATPEPAPWYMPAWSARGVLVTLAYASAATAIISGATAIGLDIDRSSRVSGLPADACRPDAASRPAACASFAERYEQQNAALGVAIGSVVATGLFGGAARIAYGFERGAARPTLAPTVSMSGGGIVILGTW